MLQIIFCYYHFVFIKFQWCCYWQIYVKFGFNCIADQYCCLLLSCTSCLGYWKILQILKSKVMKTTRTTVSNFVKERDPESVLSRTRRCYSVPVSDFLQHIDWDNQLKPYGFLIYGCIDGFFWRIIWIKVAPNNKNPSAIASYCYFAVRGMHGIPIWIRPVNGTGNSTIEPIQIFLRSSEDDEIAGIWSFLKGTSRSAN